MPDVGGPDDVGDDTSRGEVRCDTCGTVVISDVEANQAKEIRSAIERHHKETGHTEYSFYGRTKIEA